MKKCAISLPLTLLSEIKHGFVLTPFVISALSRLTGLTSVCCVNLTGLRYKGTSRQKVSERFSDFKALLKRLGSPVDHYWADNDSNHIARLQSYCEKLADLGELRSELKTIMVCQCGAVEIVAEATNSDWVMEGRLLEKRYDQFFCKLCSTPLETKQIPCLMLESRFGNVKITTLPSFYDKEVVELQKFDQPVLISRQRESDCEVSLFGKLWQLDTDFCWSLMFCSLLEDGFQPVAVVVSNHVFKQLVWALGISRKLSDKIEHMAVIVTPYVSFGEVGSQLFQTKTVSQLIDRYGRPPTRLLLGSSLKWDQKEICVSSKLIFWTLKALLCEPFVSAAGEHSMLPIEDAVKLMDGNLVDRLVTDLRKLNTVTLSQYHKLLLGKEYA